MPWKIFCTHFCCSNKVLVFELDLEFEPENSELWTLFEPRTYTKPQIHFPLPNIEQTSEPFKNPEPNSKPYQRETGKYSVSFPKIRFSNTELPEHQVLPLKPNFKHKYPEHPLSPKGLNNPRENWFIPSLLYAYF